MKVNVLGTEYTILFDVPLEDMPSEADGCMDCSTKTIKVVKLEITKDSLQDMDEYIKKILRHEIIHAFFYESGLWNCSGSSDEWAMDETITDWIAIQSPKMFQAFKEADAL